MGGENDDVIVNDCCANTYKHRGRTINSAMLGLQIYAVSGLVRLVEA